MQPYKRSRTSRKKKVTKAEIARTIRSMSEKKFASGLVFNAAPGINWTFQAIGARTTLVSQVTATDMNAGVQPGIVQGVNRYERVGNSIRIEKITFSIVITPSVANVMHDGSVCRILFVHDKAWGQAAVAGDIMETQNFYGLPRTDRVGPGKEKRYNIIKDISHQMVETAQTGAGAAGAVGPQLLTNFSIYPRSRVDFLGPGCTDTDLAIGTNAWYVMVAADGVACCTVKIGFEVVWTDI